MTIQAMAGTRQRASASRIRVSRLQHTSRICTLNFQLLGSHPSEPQCSYDPVEGLTLAPDTDPVEKIRQLESQICELNATSSSLIL